MTKAIVQIATPLGISVHDTSSSAKIGHAEFEGDEADLGALLIDPSLSDQAISGDYLRVAAEKKHADGARRRTASVTCPISAGKSASRSARLIPVWGSSSPMMTKRSVRVQATASAIVRRTASSR
jgi:hypothetical protein